MQNPAKDIAGNDVNAFVPATNPDAASDLRPIPRIEAVADRDVEHAYRHASSLIALMQQRTPEARNAINLAARADRRASRQVSMPAAAFAANPNAAADAGIGLVRETFRARRMRESARNRWTDVQEQKTSLLQPTFNEVLARLSHHPGLLRLFGLVIDCTVDVAALGWPSFGSGSISFHFSDVLDDYIGTETYPVENMRTAFDFRIPAEESPGFGVFRPSPRPTPSGPRPDHAGIPLGLLESTEFRVDQMDVVATVLRPLRADAVHADEIRTANAVHIRVSESGAETPAHAAAAGIDAAQALNAKLMALASTRNAAGVNKGDPKFASQYADAASAIVLHEEDILRGYSIDVRRSAGWYPLCRRRVRVYRHSPGDGWREIRELSCIEDGFIGESLNTAAEPITGRVTDTGSSTTTTCPPLGTTTSTSCPPGTTTTNSTTTVPPPTSTTSTTTTTTLAPVPLKPCEIPPEVEHRDITIDRLGAAEETYRVAGASTKRPDAPRTIIRSLIRDQPSLDDIQPKDLVHITPCNVPPPAGDPRLVEELYVSPPFETAELTTNAEWDALRLMIVTASCSNRTGPCSTSASVPERFSIGFAPGASGFLDAGGQTMKLVQGAYGLQLPTEIKRFVAEGERRVYVLGFTDVTTPVDVRVAAEIELNLDRAVCPSFPTAQLFAIHLDATSAAVSSLPFMMRETLANSSQDPGGDGLRIPENAGGFPWLFRFAGTVTGSQGNLGLSGVSLKRASKGGASDDLALVFEGSDFKGSEPDTGQIITGEGEVRSDRTFRVLSWRPLGAAPIRPYARWVARHLVAGADLQRVRGPVQQVEVEYIGAFEAVGPSKPFARESVTIGGTTVTLLFSFREPPADAKPRQARVTGVVQKINAGVLEVDVTSITTVESNDDNRKPLTWILSIAQPTGLARVAFPPEERKPTEPYAVQDRYVDPQQVSVGAWIEAFGVPDGGRLASPAWPRWPLGDVKIRGTDLAITFDDGDAMTVRGAPNVTCDKSGIIRIATGKDGVVSWDAQAPALTGAAVISVVSGEVVGIGRRDSDLRITLSLPSNGRTITVVCGNDLWWQPPFDLPPRRVIEIAVGDYVTAHTIVSGAEFRVALAAPSIADIAVGLRGKLTPGACSATLLGQEGTIEYAPAVFETANGVRRTIWARCRDDMAARLSDVEALLASCVAFPLAVARAHTIIDDSAPPAVVSPPPNPGPPVQVLASDLTARWPGWWLTVGEPGQSNTRTESNEPRDMDPSDTWNFRIACEIPDKQPTLPLRTAVEVGFRVWKVDPAGNNSLNLCEHATSENVADATELRHTVQRWTPPLAPLVAHLESGKYVVGVTPGSKPPVTLRFLLVTDPLTGKTIDAQHAGWTLLPPSASVETVIASGRLEKIARTGADVAGIIYAHERHCEDKRLIADTSGRLNYFADPDVTDVSLQLSEALTLAADSKVDARGSAVIVPLYKSPKQWPVCGPVKAVLSRLQRTEAPFTVLRKGDSVRLLVPAGRRAVLGVRVQVPGYESFLQPGAWQEPLDVDVLHATTSPISRPVWTSLLDDPRRNPGDTSQSFSGTLELDIPSSGGAAFSTFWNEPWDEIVPPNFREAVVEAHSEGGGLVVDVRDGGFGYATAVVEIDQLSDDVAILVPVLENGILRKLEVHDQGSGYRNPVNVRVRRRPPLHSFARAVATVRSGRVVAVALDESPSDKFDSSCPESPAEPTESAGYYVTPPTVVIHDVDGDGRNAKITARVWNGRIVSFHVDEAGVGYSNNVMVGIYTHQAQIAEQRLPERESFDVNTGDVSIRYAQHFGDTKSRVLDVVANVSTRFGGFIEQCELADAPGAANSPCTPRSTTPQRVELRASQPPEKPVVAYPLPAFVWQTIRTDKRRLTEVRDGVIRVYLQRPWNGTGMEFLGVVVMTAEKNTVAVEPFWAPIIPTELRGLVSRWGYDPVWDEVDYPALNVDDLTSAVEIVPYDELLEVPEGAPPVSVALHRVEYSPDTDQWYADIGVRSPRIGAPFVQLSVVRYQSNALPGCSMSKAVLVDPIPHPGHRRLDVRWLGSRSFSVALGGNFESRDVPENPRKKETRKRSEPNGAAARRVVVEIRKHLENVADEVQGPLLHGDATPAGESVDRVMLRRADTGDREERTLHEFKGEVPVEFTSPSDRVYLAVKEVELFPTAGSEFDHTGTANEAIGTRAYVERLVFHRAIDISPRGIVSKSVAAPAEPAPVKLTGTAKKRAATK